MIDRINTLLKAKNVTARQFAEEIGIQPSGMSHILSGRNNPSLEFIMKVMKRWPEININWLMFGKGEMYVNNNEVIHSAGDTMASEPDEVAPRPDEFDLFSQPPVPQASLDSQNRKNVVPHEEIHPVDYQEDSDKEENAPADVVVEDRPTENQSVATESKSNISVGEKPDEISIKEEAKPAARVQPIVPRKRIAKLVILYDDHSFSEYYPE